MSRIIVHIGAIRKLFIETALSFVEDFNNKLTLNGLTVKTDEDRRQPDHEGVYGTERATRKRRNSELFLTLHEAYSKGKRLTVADC